MITREDVKKLANLSRIELTPEEEDAFLAEIDPILGYVGQIQNIEGQVSSEESSIRKNVFRKDSDAHESGIFTDALIGQAPRSEKGYVKVKKILQND